VSRHLILFGGDARLRNKFHDMWELRVEPGRPLDLSVHRLSDEGAGR
jgi:hypothetical protein